jgi:hypothetical protein
MKNTAFSIGKDHFGGKYRRVEDALAIAEQVDV